MGRVRGWRWEGEGGWRWEELGAGGGRAGEVERWGGLDVGGREGKGLSESWSRSYRKKGAEGMRP